MAELKLKSKTQLNKTLEVKIEKIVPGGYGLGFAENLTVFTALAAIGDKLRVRIREKKGKVVFAEIVEILESSPQRIKPPCSYFGVCGGCDFQQMNYAAQLASKEAIIRDCLRRIGKINYEKEIEIVGSPREFGYRARARWHADTRAQKIGYFKRHSHQIIDIENCPILVDELQNKLTDLRENLNWKEFWAEKIEIETASSDKQISVYSTELIEPTQEIFFQVGGEKYYYDATGFFQGNPFLIEKLVEYAADGVKGQTALDLFCGVGLFSLPLARNFEKVIGVEANEKAIDFAKKNADYAKVPAIEFYARNVGEFLAENTFNTVDFILLDPPRTGAEPETIKSILKMRPPQLVYVSCDPATLARDLRLLTEHHYAIESIAAFDLFPQTHHIETVVRLSANDM